MGAVAFIRHSLNLSSPLGYMRNKQNSNSDAFSSLFSSASTHLTSHASNLLAKATNFFTKFSPFVITKVVETLAEGRASSENDSYCYLDAKSKTTSASTANKSVRYGDVIVFVLGGGCYNEYYNLIDLVKHKLAASGGGSNTTPVLNTALTGNATHVPRTVMYGSTELLSGEAFLGQLNQLGNK